MKTIIEMAKEAGASMQHGGGFMLGGVVAIERFAELVRADEREACAKVCDVEEETANQETWYQCAKELAKQIRARGNT